MDRTVAIRALGLYLPLSAAILLALLRRPIARTFVAAMLALAWTLPSLIALQLLNLRFEWWTFHARGGLFRGMPVDMYLGWAILWGALPTLVFGELTVVWQISMLVALDALLMPLCSPVILLSHHWLTGEVVATSLVLVPAQLIARWTLQRRHLQGRAAMQVMTVAGLFLFLIPELVFALRPGAGWSPFFIQAFWLRGLELQLLFLLAAIGVSAVQEFAQNGDGTPIPFDPPQRLVTSGIYRYVANPMQLSCTVVMICWGGVLRNPWVASAGLISFVYSLGLAAWDEGEDMRIRFGARWEEHRRNVRPWRIRWRPWQLPDVASARLYIAEACGPCSQLRRWFARRGALALDVVAAEDHPSRDLQRITYDPMNGARAEEGVWAFARALEHINFAWAFAGAVLRLPGIGHFIQLMMDASGLGPQPVTRRGAVVCSSIPRP